MTLALKTDLTGYKTGDIRDAVAYALSAALAQARQRVDHYTSICSKFEQKYRLDSNEFMKKFEGGQMGDEQDFFDWFAAKRGLDVWHGRYEILSKVSV